MGNLPRDERIARQDLDDGDGDDAVWYFPSRAQWNRKEVTGSRKPTASHYHEDPTCPCLVRGDQDDPPREVTRRDAHRKWLAPCSKCTIDPDDLHDGDGDDDGGRSYTAYDVREAVATDTLSDLLGGDGGESA